MSASITALSIAPALLLAQFPFQGGVQPDKNQQLAMYSKPAIVRIVEVCAGTYEYKGNSYPFFTGNSGSGFFVDRNGYIVTNVHVIQLTVGKRQGCEDRILDNVRRKLNVSVDDLKKNGKLLSDGFVYGSKVFLGNGDSFDFDIKEKGDLVFDEEEQRVGKDVAVIKVEVTDAPVLKLENDTDEVQPLEPVVVLGYPGTADDTSILSDKSLYEASVFTGSIANAGKTLQNGSSVLQLNVTAAPGSSGGPVLDQEGNVIGMITFGHVGANQETGIPFAVRSSTIAEFTRRSGAAIEEGNTGALYKEGLDLFWKGDYEGAKVKFEAVKDLFKQHSEADNLIKECNQKIAELRSKRSYLPLLAGVGVAIAGLLGAYFIVRRRSVPAPADSVVDLSGTDAARAGQPATLVSRQSPASTAVSTQPYIELKNAQGQSRTFYLKATNHRLGRDRLWADLKVPDEGWEVISKHHARLQKERDGYRIYDGERGQRSTNGILINGVLIPDDGYLLQDGDHLHIGQDPQNQATLVYVVPQGDRAASHYRANSRGT